MAGRTPPRLGCRQRIDECLVIQSIHNIAHSHFETGLAGETGGFASESSRAIASEWAFVCLAILGPPIKKQCCRNRDWAERSPAVRGDQRRCSGFSVDDADLQHSFDVPRGKIASDLIPQELHVVS